jgi:hypothetical protein
MNRPLPGWTCLGTWPLGSARKRVWSTLRDVPPERIKRVLCFIELAGASLDD